MTQEERGLPLPKEPDSVVEEEDCTIVDVVTGGGIPENLVPEEASEGKVDESSTGLFSKPSWLADDTENVKRVPRRRGGREGSPTRQGPLKKAKANATTVEESGGNENGAAQNVGQAVNEEALLQWITTSDGVRCLT